MSGYAIGWLWLDYNVVLSKYFSHDFEIAGLVAVYFLRGAEIRIRDYDELYSVFRKELLTAFVVNSTLFAARYATCSLFIVKKWDVLCVLYLVIFDDQFTVAIVSVDR